MCQLDTSLQVVYGELSLMFYSTVCVGDKASFNPSTLSQFYSQCSHESVNGRIDLSSRDVTGLNMLFMDF